MNKIFVVLSFVFLPHLTLASTLSANAFFSSSSIYSPTISPNGKRVAYVESAEDEHALVVKNIDTGSVFIPSSIRSKDVENEFISNLHWIDNKFLTFTHVEKKVGVSQLLDTKFSARILVLDTEGNVDDWKTYSVRTKGKFVSALPEKAGKFLYAKSGSVSRVYELDVNLLAEEDKSLGKLDPIDGGQFVSRNVLRQVDGFSLFWFFDQNDRVSASLKFDRKGQLALVSFSDTGEEYFLKVWDENDAKGEKEKKNLLPVQIGPSSSKFYCYDQGERLTRSVYLVDYNTGEESLVYQTSGYEIKNLHLSDDGDLVGVGVLRNGIPIIELVTAEEPEDISLSKNPMAEALLNSSLLGEREVVYSEAHNRPGAYFVREQGKNIQRLGIFPDLPEVLDSELVREFIDVEGLSIPYLLSKPSKSGVFPLIVLPHGGPIGVHDHPYFDQITQFLVKNNYAVLRVNFRGSSGYSDELQDAGDKQWYSGMLNDIELATHQVMQRPDIDSAKVCTLGFSYGGYASSMLAIRNEDIFKCVASVSAVTDLALYLTSSYLSEDQYEWALEKVGNLRTEEEQLRAGSVVDNTSKLNVPLFLAHGFKDRTVDVEHAYRYKYLLDRFGKDYEFFVDQESDHFFDGPGAMAKLMDRIVVFLDRHLK